MSKEMPRIYFSPTSPVSEPFNLEKDPREFDNLAGKQEALAIEHELKTVLQEWMTLERDFLPLPIVSERRASQR